MNARSAHCIHTRPSSDTPKRDCQLAVSTDGSSDARTQSGAPLSIAAAVFAALFALCVGLGLRWEQVVHRISPAGANRSRHTWHILRAVTSASLERGFQS
jgi:hypothetical protein